ncbi:UvrD-helicase domain-containing protein [Castellaniella sp.]|uniref:UvrD-helicase domain-containing protein n=1 Tax=Castellaniella sp. TaxID=1955812 RepID=UPI00355D39B3
MDRDTVVQDAPGGLNERQREAVRHLDGPCLVLAGAGSGKTRVITRKMAYLLGECGYQARHVVALTFTNKAAREMNERVRAQVGARLLRGLTVGTFHSLGLRFLREEHGPAGLKPGFSVLDAADALAIVQNVLDTTDRARLRAVQQQISLWKNALLGPDEAAARASDMGQAEALRVYRSYQATLQAWQSVDFDDLIYRPARLLGEDTDMRARWQARIHYLLVDEYQDTSTCQYELLRHLIGSRARFTAVGDDDQAIYAWRGATSENLVQLARDYPDLRVIKLEQNYRSVQTILQAANRVIAHNPRHFEKTLWSDLGAGAPIGLMAMDTDQLEAESVAMRLSAERFGRAAHWKDFAVLYRSNHQARILEQALRALRIPYTVSGGQSFFDKTEVRDIMAWLRLIANVDEDPAFIRAVSTPRRGIGQSTLAILGSEAARQGCSLFAAALHLPAEAFPTARQALALGQFVQLVQGFCARLGEAAAKLLDDVLQAIGYEAYLYDMLDDRQARTRWGHVLELREWLVRKADEEGLTLVELVQRVALVTLLERSDEETPDAVKLSTLHAAKGLEFPHVYLVGVEEGLLPHRGNEEDGGTEPGADASYQSRLEEERRLMYVGMTRAQRTLQISWCRRRRRGRDEVLCEPSRFIAEMGLQPERPVAVADPQATLARLRQLLKK